MQKYPDNSIDLVLSDPPFKVSQFYGGGVDADNLINVASILRTLPEVSRVLKNGRFAVFFYDNRILPFLFEAVKGTDLMYKKSIYLYRRWGAAHKWMGWMQCTDPICFFTKGYAKPFKPKLKGKIKHDCYTKAGPEKDNTGHPAQKPIEVIKDIISWCSDEDEIVLDPYAGSGTVCLAAKLLNRKYIGIEIIKEYVDLSLNRLKTINNLSDFLPTKTLIADIPSNNGKEGSPC